MSLNIKNPEAHTLAARLAEKTGETLTEALVEGSRQLWSDALLSVDHGELLYDELGLPK